MADDQIAISIKGASKTYDEGARDAIRDISLDIRAGEFIVIVGESGSGKTTLLKTINRLIDPTPALSGPSAPTSPRSIQPPCAGASAMCSRRSVSSRI